MSCLSFDGCSQCSIEFNDFLKRLPSIFVHELKLTWLERARAIILQGEKWEAVQMGRLGDQLQFVCLSAATAASGPKRASVVGDERVRVLLERMKKTPLGLAHARLWFPEETGDNDGASSPIAGHSAKASAGVSPTSTTTSTQSQQNDVSSRAKWASPIASAIAKTYAELSRISLDDGASGNRITRRELDVERLKALARVEHEEAGLPFAPGEGDPIFTWNPLASCGVTQGTAKLIRLLEEVTASALAIHDPKL